MAEKKKAQKKRFNENLMELVYKDDGAVISLNNGFGDEKKTVEFSIGKGGKRYCKTCKNNFPYKSAFIAHLQCEEHLGAIKCNLCAKQEFDSYKALKVHYDAKHGKYVDKDSISANGKPIGAAIVKKTGETFGLKDVSMDSFEDLEVTQRNVILGDSFGKNEGKTIYTGFSAVKILNNENLLLKPLCRLLILKKNNEFTDVEWIRMKTEGMKPYGKVNPLAQSISFFGRYCKLICDVNGISFDDLTWRSLIERTHIDSFCAFYGSYLKRAPHTIILQLGYLKKWIKVLKTEPEVMEKFAVQVNCFLAHVELCTLEWTKRNDGVVASKGFHDWEVALEKGGILADSETKALFKFLNINFIQIKEVFDTCEISDFSHEKMGKAQYSKWKKWAIFAQSICYHLIAFGFYGQRSQINVNLQIDGWVHDKSLDCLIYLPKTEKVTRTGQGIYLPIWCGPVYLVQTKLIRIILLARGKYCNNDAVRNMWIAPRGGLFNSGSKTKMTHFFKDWYSPTIAVSESRTYRRTFFTKFINENQDFIAKTDSFALVCANFTAYVASHTNTDHNMMVRHYNQVANTEASKIIQDGYLKKNVGDVDADFPALNAEELLQCEFTNYDPAHLPNSRVYVLYDFEKDVFNSYFDEKLLLSTKKSDSVFFKLVKDKAPVMKKKLPFITKKTVKSYMNDDADDDTMVDDANDESMVILSSGDEQILEDIINLSSDSSNEKKNEYSEEILSSNEAYTSEEEMNLTVIEEDEDSTMPPIEMFYDYRASYPVEYAQFLPTFKIDFSCREKTYQSQFNTHN